MILRVIDVETDGLPPDARVVEIATVDLIFEPPCGDLGTPGQWTRGRMHYSLINNERPIPPEISAIHHITSAMVKDAPTIGIFTDKACWTGMEWSADQPAPHYVVAHNARFEAALLPGIKIPWLCTYKAALALWPEAPSHGNQALRYWLNLNLALYPHEQDFPHMRPHRALGDAYVTAAIARSILARTTIEEWADISSRPALLRRFRFGKHQGVPLAEVPIDYLEWVTKNITDDEDVQYTAREHIRRRRETARARSPV